jgi:hypothetical protein
MDAGSRLSAGRISRPQAAESPPEVAHKTAKISDWCDASQVPAASLARIADGFIGKGVQMSGGNVLFKLFVPRGGVKLGEPVAERQKLLTGELADGGFDLVNGTHVRRITQLRFQGKCRGAPSPAMGAGQKSSCGRGKTSAVEDL